ncbi:MAG: hypothetical protein K6E98_10250 [Lachnospiraceae bacterium]|nr:hypothetical protein [Lachnospiraceae bacterium]
MKFSLIKNDKSTVMDELVLGIMVICSLVIGILLMIAKPEFWVISSKASVLTGLVFVVFGVMFIPALIYRFFTNDKQQKVR